VTEVVGQPVYAVFLSGPTTAPFKKNAVGKRMPQVVETRALIPAGLRLTLAIPALASAGAARDKASDQYRRFRNRVGAT
jgi:hypothetical protein